MREYVRDATPESSVLRKASARCGEFLSTSRLSQLSVPASVIGMAGCWFSGLWIPTVTHYYLLSLAPAMVAIFLGRAINHRLQGNAFLKYIYIALGGIGALLLLQA